MGGSRLRAELGYWILGDASIASRCAAALGGPDVLEALPDARAVEARLAEGRAAVLILDSRGQRAEAAFALCRRIRARYPGCAVLLLVDDDENARLGDPQGPNDYVRVPGRLAELRVRVAALEHGVAERTARDRTALRRSDLVIEPAEGRVRVGDRAVPLTRKELDLLAYLARADRTCSAAELLRAIWGYQNPGYMATVRTHVNRLRRKIEDDPARPRRLLTVRGRGYRLESGSSTGHR